MEEVHWQNLEAGKEYYIERVLEPTPSPFLTHTTTNIPLGQKKKGTFVTISYDQGTPFAMFRNLMNPSRGTEGPYLPSALGSVEENKFSVNVHRFYRPVSHQIALNQVERKFGDMTNTNFGETVIFKNPYLGGKKSRKTKKSKRTKKGKRSKKGKKSKKNKKRY